MTEFTTMEKLQMKVGPSGAVLKYGEKVLVTCETYYGFTAEVYEFVETPEETGLGYIECRLLFFRIFLFFLIKENFIRKP